MKQGFSIRVLPVVASVRLAVAAAIGLWGLAGAAWGGAADAFYERSLMVAADNRCRLFSPPISGALAAGKAQARGAALRTGADAAALLGLERQAAAKAGSAACGSAELKLAAGRVQAGFQGYQRLARLDLPGEIGGWRATRAIPAKDQAWRLSQPVRFGADRAIFGLYAGAGSGLGAAVTFADGAVPYAARLVVRDPARAPSAYLRGWKPGGRLPLAARTPPAAAAQSFLAQTRGAADPALAPTATQPAILFRFPAAAADALSRLDPREAVTVEFLFAARSGDTIRRAHVEIGDFAAGLAFLRAG